NHNSWPDHLVMSSAMLGISIPNMVLAPILLLFLGIKMRLLPVSGLETFSSYILPSFCLSLFFIANIARLTRGSMLEVLSSNYIRTARSKGLPTWRIVVFHCLKPTLIPVVSYLGPATAGMLAGSLVIEKIFVIPGIGRQFVDSAFARDYTMALGMILFYCTLVVFFNALVDISYMFLDPKIRKK
ncbi:MAG: ABC transporter permease subunit, partial [Bdellovibrionota bacterium]|nr:ABC transporter permease subunit [Bdellovibrionota bacterium]